jgi:hypothetical protein
MGRGSRHGDREGCLLAVLGDERRRGELLQGSSAMDREGRAAEGRRWGRAPWLGCWASYFEQGVGKGLQQGSAMGGKRRRLCSLLAPWKGEQRCCTWGGGCWELGAGASPVPWEVLLPCAMNREEGSCA